MSLHNHMVAAINDARDKAGERISKLMNYAQELSELKSAIRSAVDAAKALPGSPPWEPHPEFVKFVTNKIEEGRKL